MTTPTTSLRERVNAAIERLRAPALMFDSDRRAIADELEAALTAPASPPALEGMVLVPREPTPALLRKFLGNVDMDDAALSYAAMLAASPVAVQPDSEHVETLLQLQAAIFLPVDKELTEAEAAQIRALSAAIAAMQRPVAVQPEGGEYVDPDDVFLMQDTDDVPCLCVPGRVLVRFIPGSWALAYELWCGNTRPVAAQQAVRDGSLFAALDRLCDDYANEKFPDAGAAAGREMVAVITARNNMRAAQPPEAATQEGPMANLNKSLMATAVNAGIEAAQDSVAVLLTDLRDSRLMRLHGDAYMPRIEAAIASLQARDEFAPTGSPQECDTMESAVMLAERALWQDDEGVRWVPEAAYQRAMTEIESLESKLYPMGAAAPGDESLQAWAARVAAQFDAMGESYDARRLRELAALATPSAPVGVEGFGLPDAVELLRSLGPKWTAYGLTDDEQKARAFDLRMDLLLIAEQAATPAVSDAKDAAFGAWCRTTMQATGPIHTMSGKDVYGILTPAVDRDAGVDAAIDAAIASKGDQ